MKHRGLAVALAVLLAVVGTVGVFGYVSHANSRAIAGQRAVSVLVAQKMVPAGTSAGAAQAQGLLRTETLPASSVPADAVSSLTPDLKVLVTSADVPSGMLLLRSMLVTQAQASTGLAIPSGMVAVSILFCMPEEVAGNLHAGSEIAVFDTIISGSAGLSAQNACSGPHQWQAGVSATTRLVLPKVEVLSVGAATASSGSRTNSTQNTNSTSQNLSLVTLAVSQADAQQLILMTEDGLPYLAIVNDQSSLSVTAPAATAPGH
jgi:pilus assembly protein CpaB